MNKSFLASRALMFLFSANPHAQEFAHPGILHNPEGLA